MDPESAQRRTTPMLKRADEAGFAARSAGVPRDMNPHVGAATLPYVNLADASQRPELARAWWRGWDRADSDLRST
jgi:hypothetical protein